MPEFDEEGKQCPRSPKAEREVERRLASIQHSRDHVFGPPQDVDAVAQKIRGASLPAPYDRVSKAARVISEQAYGMPGPAARAAERKAMQQSPVHENLLSNQTEDGKDISQEDRQRLVLIAAKIRRFGPESEVVTPGDRAFLEEVTGRTAFGTESLSTAVKKRGRQIMQPIRSEEDLKSRGFMQPTMAYTSHVKETEVSTKKRAERAASQAAATAADRNVKPGVAPADLVRKVDEERAKRQQGLEELSRDEKKKVFTDFVERQRDLINSRRQKREHSTFEGLAQKAATLLERSHSPAVAQAATALRVAAAPLEGGNTDCRATHAKPFLPSTQSQSPSKHPTSPGVQRIIEATIEGERKQKSIEGTAFENFRALQQHSSTDQLKRVGKSTSKAINPESDLVARGAAYAEEHRKVLELDASEKARRQTGSPVKAAALNSKPFALSASPQKAPAQALPAKPAPKSATAGSAAATSPKKGASIKKVLRKGVLSPKPGQAASRASSSLAAVPPNARVQPPPPVPPRKPSTAGVAHSAAWNDSVAQKKEPHHEPSAPRPFLRKSQASVIPSRASSLHRAEQAAKERAGPPLSRASSVASLRDHQVPPQRSSLSSRRADFATAGQAPKPSSLLGASQHSLMQSNHAGEQHAVHEIVAPRISTGSSINNPILSVPTKPIPTAVTSLDDRLALLVAERIARQKEAAQALQTAPSVAGSVASGHMEDHFEITAIPDMPESLREPPKPPVHVSVSSSSIAPSITHDDAFGIAHKDNDDLLVSLKNLSQSIQNDQAPPGATSLPVSLRPSQASLAESFAQPARAPSSTSQQSAPAHQPAVMTDEEAELQALREEEEKAAAVLAELQSRKASIVRRLSEVSQPSQNSQNSRAGVLAAAQKSDDQPSATSSLRNYPPQQQKTVEAEITFNEQPGALPNRPSHGASSQGSAFSHRASSHSLTTPVQAPAEIVPPVVAPLAALPPVMSLEEKIAAAVRARMNGGVDPLAAPLPKPASLAATPSVSEKSATPEPKTAIRVPMLNQSDAASSVKGYTNNRAPSAGQGSVAGSNASMQPPLHAAMSTSSSVRLAAARRDDLEFDMPPENQFESREEAQTHALDTPVDHEAIRMSLVSAAVNQVMRQSSSVAGSEARLSQPNSRASDHGGLAQESSQVAPVAYQRSPASSQVSAPAQVAAQPPHSSHHSSSRRGSHPAQLPPQQSPSLAASSNRSAVPKTPPSAPVAPPAPVSMEDKIRLAVQARLASLGIAPVETSKEPEKPWQPDVTLEDEFRLPPRPPTESSLNMSGVSDLSGLKGLTNLQGIIEQEVASQIQEVMSRLSASGNHAPLTQSSVSLAGSHAGSQAAAVPVPLAHPTPALRASQASQASSKAAPVPLPTPTPLPAPIMRASSAHSAPRKAEDTPVAPPAAPSSDLARVAETSPALPDSTMSPEALLDLFLDQDPVVAQAFSLEMGQSPLLQPVEVDLMTQLASGEQRNQHTHTIETARKTMEHLLVSARGCIDETFFNNAHKLKTVPATKKNVGIAVAMLVSRDEAAGWEELQALTRQAEKDGVNFGLTSCLSSLRPIDLSPKVLKKLGKTFMGNGLSPQTIRDKNEQAAVWAAWVRAIHALGLLERESLANKGSDYHV